MTAWYKMRLTAIGEDRATLDPGPVGAATNLCETRDRTRAGVWQGAFTARRVM